MDKYDIYKKLSIIVKNDKVSFFEYIINENRYIEYNECLDVSKDISNYTNYITQSDIIDDDDKHKMIQFFKNKTEGILEINTTNPRVPRYVIKTVLYNDEEHQKEILLGSILAKNERKKNIYNEELVQKDSLTMLYNPAYGKKLINHYLNNKDVNESCALLLIDIDDFKYINNRYGFFLGDIILKKLANLFIMTFSYNSVIVRVSGDQFVVLLENIDYLTTKNTVDKLISDIRAMDISDKHIKITCSIGVAFVEKNMTNYNYNKLLKSADWTMYRAKLNGRNQYGFSEDINADNYIDDEQFNYIDPSYLKDDVGKVTINIFERYISFPIAIKILLQFLSIKYHVSRVTLFKVDDINRILENYYQWHRDNVDDTFKYPVSLNNEDYIKFIYNRDKNGMLVLNKNNINNYSLEIEKIFLKSDSYTSVYGLIYRNDILTAILSLEDCEHEGRVWSEEALESVSKVCTLIGDSIHDYIMSNEYSDNNESDRLTSLMNLNKFKTKTSIAINQNLDKNYVLVYTDFENFRYINQEYNYSIGDKLLRDFSNDVLIKTSNKEQYFSRVISDQFISFKELTDNVDVEKMVKEKNKTFEQYVYNEYNGLKIRLKSGIYFLKKGDTIETAIDCANFARKSIHNNNLSYTRVYDDDLDYQRVVRREVLSNFDYFLENGNFQVYIQPKFSLLDYTPIGGEALVRLYDGKRLLPPDIFISLYEESGDIVRLDEYVFRQVVKLIKENERLNRKQYPISVNLSAIDTKDATCASRYIKILDDNHIDHSLIEIELTETDTISNLENVKVLLKEFQEASIKTSLDDFGAGYSILNSIIDVPINTIKIDKQFLTYCKESKKGIFFLRQLIHLFREMNYGVICEGVETKQQAELLTSLGCYDGQGYLYSKPLPLDEYIKFIYKGEKNEHTKNMEG